MEKIEIKPGMLFKNEEGEWRVTEVGRFSARVEEVNTEEIDFWPIHQLIDHLQEGDFEYLGDVSQK